MKVAEIINEIDKKIEQMRKSGLCTGKSDLSSEIRNKYVKPLMKARGLLEDIKELDTII